MTSIYGLSPGSAPLQVVQGRTAGLTSDGEPGAIRGALQVIRQNTPSPPDGTPAGAGTSSPPPKVFGNGSLIDFEV